ncbi:MAG: deoxynucleoside kinase [Candidatus Marinimicrobia bacterium]|nr:deoxynucleoside kinase [Candidatus Neomarinimicrobiota bacterium]MDP6965938.1 deoxynucleoside kinase [Candidatus Neomarinimicrobiota bacterium]
MSRQPFVSVAGNIAVGKTTLTTIIADRLSWRPFFESVEDNPYLSDFYGDMKRWSFHLQIYFLSKRFMTQREMASGNIPAVQDRTIYEDVEIFARSLYDMGNMSDRDWRSYKDLFYEMTSYLAKPALILYLKASTDTLMTRMKSRGRDYEKTVSPEYLHRLNMAYSRWVESAEDELNIVTVETDGFNVYEDEDGVEKILAKVWRECGLEQAETVS